MIQNNCFTSAWIDRVSKQLKYNDKYLIEKVIRALSLLEMLVEPSVRWYSKAAHR